MTTKCGANICVSTDSARVWKNPVYFVTFRDSVSCLQPPNSGACHAHTREAWQLCNASSCAMADSQRRERTGSLFLFEAYCRSNMQSWPIRRNLMITNLVSSYISGVEYQMSLLRSMCFCPNYQYCVVFLVLNIRWIFSGACVYAPINNIVLYFWCWISDESSSQEHVFMPQSTILCCISGAEYQMSLLRSVCLCPDQQYCVVFLVLNIRWVFSGACVYAPINNIVLYFWCWISDESSEEHVFVPQSTIFCSIPSVEYQMSLARSMCLCPTLPHFSCSEKAHAFAILASTNLLC